MASGIPIENPVLDVVVGRVGSVARVGPLSFDLVHKLVFVLFCALLDLITLGLNLFLETSSVPIHVGRFNGGGPFGLHKVLEVLTISRSWVRNVMI